MQMIVMWTTERVHGSRTAAASQRTTNYTVRTAAMIQWIVPWGVVGSSAAGERVADTAAAAGESHAAGMHTDAAGGHGGAVVAGRRKSAGCGRGVGQSIEGRRINVLHHQSRRGVRRYGITGVGTQGCATIMGFFLGGEGRVMKG